MLSSGVACGGRLASDSFPDSGGGGTYCYNRMPFGLKNAGATFSRTVKEMLKGQLGGNATTYIDDIVVKSLRERDHVSDLAKTFQNFRRVGLRLNPAKCMFGVRSRKLLGYLVSKDGIDPNPVKIQAIIDMEPPQSKRDLQKFTG